MAKRSLFAAQFVVVHVLDQLLLAYLEREILEHDSRIGCRRFTAGLAVMAATELQRVHADGGSGEFDHLFGDGHGERLADAAVCAEGGLFWYAPRIRPRYAENS